MHFLDLEIKAMPKHAPDANVVGTVVSLIKKQKTEALVMLSSDYHPYLRLCKALAPETATTALQADRRSDSDQATKLWGAPYNENLAPFKWRKQEVRGNQLRNTIKNFRN